MLDAFSDLPAWCRMLVTLIVLSIGGWMSAWGAMNGPKYQTVTRNDGKEITIETAAKPGARTSLRVGVVVVGAGVVMLMLSGKSRSEKAGYNF